MRVLMITGVWPTPAHPERAPFVVRQADYLRRAGVTVDVLHLDGRGHPGRYFRRWREVRRMASRQRYDIVHAQWGQSALVALPKVAPLIVTFRGSDLEGIVEAGGHHGLASRLLTGLSRFVARHADEVIVVSERLARHLPGRVCHVIPSGLDLERFVPMPKAEARARLELRSDRRYVLFAASPANPVKRHALAVQALQHMADDEVELLAVSGVSPELMPVYMNACDLLLLTSAHEGSPNVVKEALACNLPVVAVDVGDVAQRLAPVSGCRVCADDRPETIAEAVRAVLLAREPIAGRAAVAELDEHRLTERVVAIYRSAMARKGEGSRSDGRR